MPIISITKFKNSSQLGDIITMCAQIDHNISVKAIVNKEHSKSCMLLWSFEYKSPKEKNNHINQIKDLMQWSNQPTTVFTTEDIKEITNQKMPKFLLK